MKTLPTLFFAALVLAACDGQKKDSPIDAAFSPEDELIQTINTECFQYLGEKDTVSLTTHMNGTSVTGTLDYQIFEKDKNTGKIEGEIRDGLMILEYTFMSEGSSSKRQVVFKNSGEGWKEGYGEMKEVDGILVHVAIDSLDYENSHSLVPVPCE